ncbi:type II toxin-antitoxin system RelE/ParE family toxin [Brachybacterium subflavum]|uniref:type II toxin-antitoxin system RelE/ParE family toxin n=1 Tax=Brachybacterium subflavum TaxID=2585206 RepID=UPI0012665294|nr:type II toxin-antitoxin system RelE/ParE family toxin [Brachybacterium subflavum]
MSRFRLTPAAQRDLSEIWDFTESRWDASQVESYLRDILNAIERAAADPDRGRPVDEIRQGYRRYATGGHLVFFVRRGDRIDVIRILHQRMDPSRHL